MRTIWDRERERATEREKETERERKFSLAWQLDLWSNVDAMCEFFIVVYAPPIPTLPSMIFGKRKTVTVSACVCVCVCFIHAVHPVRASGSVFHSVCNRKSKTSWCPLYAPNPLRPQQEQHLLKAERVCVFLSLFSGTGKLLFNGCFMRVRHAICQIPRRHLMQNCEQEQIIIELMVINPANRWTGIYGKWENVLALCAVRQYSSESLGNYKLIKGLSQLRDSLPFEEMRKIKGIEGKRRGREGKGTEAR